MQRLPLAPSRKKSKVEQLEKTHNLYLKLLKGEKIWQAILELNSFDYYFD